MCGRFWGKVQGLERVCRGCIGLRMEVRPELMSIIISVEMMSLMAIILTAPTTSLTPTPTTQHQTQKSPLLPLHRLVTQDPV